MVGPRTAGRLIRGEWNWQSDSGRIAVLDMVDPRTTGRDLNQQARAGQR